MKVLIIGDTGNLGSSIVNKCQKENIEYFGISKNTSTYSGAWNSLHDIGRFDIVVMAHGVQERISLSEVNDDNWNKIIDNNLKSPVIITTILAKEQVVKHGGLIVYISSIQAAQPREGRGLYAIAKGGIETLTRIAAVEFTQYNVRTVCLRLGQMTKSMKGITFDDAQIASIKKKTPLPWVDGNKVADFIFDLYKQESLSGEVIEISSLHKMSIWP